MAIIRISTLLPSALRNRNRRSVEKSDNLPRINADKGVGGEVQYVRRIIDRQIDNRTFQAPVAWLLTELANAPVLLGREVVFDLFDIKFVQAEERIEFEWRGKKA